MAARNTILAGGTALALLLAGWLLWAGGDRRDVGWVAAGRGEESGLNGSQKAARLVDLPGDSDDDGWPASAEGGRVAIAEQPDEMAGHRQAKAERVAVLPGRLRWVDRLSGEPLGMESFRIEDANGRRFEGQTKTDGWVDVPLGLTPGPVTLTRLPETQAASASLTGRRGSEPIQRLLLAGHGGEGGDACVWMFADSRHVPIRFDLTSTESKVYPTDLDDVELWVSCAGTTTAGEDVFVRLALRRRWEWSSHDNERLGATHSFRLPMAADGAWGRSTIGGDGLESSPACWAHEKAGQLIADRRLVLALAIGGRIYASDTREARLPRLGEEPIVVVLREQGPNQLPHPGLAVRLGLEAQLQQDDIDRVAAEKARPIYELRGVVRSRTGTYQGEVLIRANPVTRNKRGGHDLRQQWITAKWQEVAGGHFEAPFHLDHLDGGRYSVRFLAPDGTRVDEPVISIDTTDKGLGPLEVMILD